MESSQLQTVPQCSVGVGHGQGASGAMNRGSQHRCEIVGHHDGIGQQHRRLTGGRTLNNRDTTGMPGARHLSGNKAR